MLARLRVLLPFVVSTRTDVAPVPQTFDLEGYGIRLYALYPTSVDPASLRPDSMLALLCVVGLVPVVLTYISTRRLRSPSWAWRDADC